MMTQFSNMSPSVEMKAKIPIMNMMLIDVDGLARMLALTPGAVRTMMKRGQIPEEVVVKVGRRLRFDMGRVSSWIEACRRTPRA